MSVPAPESPSFEHVDFEALDSFRFPDGGGYPQSYREFVRSCGWARTFGPWLIYPPVQPGFADGRARAANLTEHFHTVFRDGEEEEFDWMIEPDGSWDLAERLEVFGWSENGDLLLWDVASRNADEEFPSLTHSSSGSVRGRDPLGRHRDPSRSGVKQHRPQATDTFTARHTPIARSLRVDVDLSHRARSDCAHAPRLDILRQLTSRPTPRHTDRRKAGRFGAPNHDLTRNSGTTGRGCGRPTALPQPRHRPA
ncbi:hypothetical protein [Rhodococcus sp. NPDC003348]